MRVFHTGGVVLKFDGLRRLEASQWTLAVHPSRLLIYPDVLLRNSVLNTYDPYWIRPAQAVGLPEVPAYCFVGRRIHQTGRLRSGERREQTHPPRLWWPY